MSRSPLFRNIVSMLIWQGGNYLVPLVTLPYLSRVLGVDTFGHVAFAYAVVAYFVMITEWGFSLSSSRLISRNADDRAEVTRIFWNTLNAKLMIGGVSLIVLYSVAALVPDLRAIFPLILAASLAVIANMITVNWCLQGLERLDFFAAGSLIGKVATVPLILLLVKGPEDAWLSITLQTGGLVFSGLLSVILLARMKVIGPWARSFAGAIGQITGGWYVFLSSAAVNLYTTTNLVILGALTTPAGVGQYSGADRLKTAAQGVISPVSNAIYPRVSRLMQNDHRDAYPFLRKLLLIQGCVTFLISLMLFLLAPWLIELILGADFLPATPIMRWLAWLPFLIGLGNVLGLQVLLQTGHQALFSRIIISAVPISLCIIFPAVMAWGPIGAAIASVATETYVTAAMAIAAARTNPELFRRRKELA